MSGEKLLTESVRAERAVLSAWLYDARFRAAWKPEPELFASPGARALAASMARLGSTADADLLLLDLQRNGELKHFDGGPEGVSEILHGTPAVADPWRVLERVRELNALRALRQRLTDALRAAEATLDLSATRALVSEALAGSWAGTGSAALTIREAFADVVREATSPREERKTGIPLGIPKLDRETGGVCEQSVWVIAAESNWGKSACVVMLAEHAVEHGIRPCIVTGEDPVKLYARRWLARRALVPAWRLRDGDLSEDDLRAAVDEAQHAPDWPCFIDGRGKRPETLAGDIRSLVATHQVGLVLVDYLQVWALQMQHENQRLRTALVARIFSDVIKQTGVAGVLFSQVTKDDRGVHIRDSEDVRNCAEVVLYGLQETEPELDHAGRAVGQIEKKFFQVDKVKDGRKGFRADLRWSPQYAAFQMPDNPHQRSIFRHPERYEDE